MSYHNYTNGKSSRCKKKKSKVRFNSYGQLFSAKWPVMTEKIIYGIWIMEVQ